MTHRQNLAGVTVLTALWAGIPIAVASAAAPDAPPAAPLIIVSAPESPAAVIDDFALTDAATVAAAHQVWLVADAARAHHEAAQLAAWLEAEERARARAVPVGLTDGQLYRLRICESTDNYAIDTGNGYWGAYQFDRATWNGVAARWAPAWVGVLPSHAPPTVQDALTRALWSERGRYPWPVCGLRV